MPETRSTILEMKKAKKLRQQTGQDNIYALHEKDRSSPGRLYKVTLIRPFKFLFTEPVSYALGRSCERDLLTALPRSPTGLRLSMALPTVSSSWPTKVRRAWLPSLLFP